MIIFTVNSSHRRKRYELFIRVTENVNIEMNILKTGKQNNFTLEQAIKLHRGSRGIALLLR
jgi:hypothetical protein